MFDVFVITKEQTNFRQYAILAGGMAVVKTSVGMGFSIFSQIMKEELKIENKDSGYSFIIIVEEFYNKLNKNELAAALAHEERRISYLDILMWKVRELSTTQENEFEADEYAAFKTSPADLISGLKKSTDFIIEVVFPELAKENNHDEETVQLAKEEFNKAYVEIIQPRIDRLEVILVV